VGLSRPVVLVRVHTSLVLGILGLVSTYMVYIEGIHTGSQYCVNKAMTMCSARINEIRTSPV